MIKDYALNRLHKYASKWLVLAIDLFIIAISFEKSQSCGLDAATSVSQFSGLTPRQLDVLRGIAQGHSNKQIAIDLGISPFTVRIHVSALLRELKVETRTAAAAMASKYGV